MRFVPYALTLALALAAGTAYAAPDTKMMDTSAGSVITDADGMTLYSFDKDETNMSNCYEQCAINWPPFFADADAADDGDWTVVDRTDGTKMWAYEGMPLYYWKNDAAPGDVTGDGVGGVWHVVK